MSRPLPPLPMPDHRDAAHAACRAGLRIGGVLAIAISWSLNKSILWAVLHGICSWAYVAYYAVFL